MLKIGAMWGKVSEKNKRYLSIGLDPTVLELYPQLKECSLIAFFVEEKDRKNENSPTYELFLDVKKKKKQEENIVEITDDEIPF